MVKEIYIVRHGETNYNLEERIQGQINNNSCLTEKGWLKAEELGKNLCNLGIRFDKVYSSDLRRAKETTKAILKYLGNLPLEYVPELRERSFGCLQGKTIQDIGIKDYKGADLYTLNREGILSDAESLESIGKRVNSFIQMIVKSKNCRVLVVGHEWINSYLINALLNENHIFHEQDNVAFHYFKLDDKGKFLEYKLNNSNNYKSQNKPFEVCLESKK